MRKQSTSSIGDQGSFNTFLTRHKCWCISVSLSISPTKERVFVTNRRLAKFLDAVFFLRQHGFLRLHFLVPSRPVPISFVPRTSLTTYDPSFCSSHFIYIRHLLIYCRNDDGGMQIRLRSRYGDGGENAEGSGKGRQEAAHRDIRDLLRGTFGAEVSVYLNDCVRGKKFYP